MKTMDVRKSFQLLGLILVAGMIASCSATQQQIDSKDLSYLYNPNKNPINPRYNITWQTEKTAEFSVKFFSTELFFTEANPRGVPMAMILVTVKLYNITAGSAIADTAVLNLNIIKQAGQTEYIFTSNLDVERGNDYIAEIKVLDRIRTTVIQAFIPFNTLSDFNRYNFIARGHFEKNQIFNPVLRENELVNLVYSKGQADSLYISFYRPFMPVPDPPSMLLPEKTINYDPDTTISLAYSPLTPIMFPRRGIYLCSVKKDLREGFTFLNLGHDFPKMSTPETMIESLAYLATEDEILTLRTASKPKAALDDFWIKLGGNVDKSRELIRIYYTRVLYSNYYFTSYKEGWRTERGMIYIIYGPPDKVYKSVDGESWGYKKPGVKSKWGNRFSSKEDYLFFTFRKKNNSFSDNDYYLSRTETPVTFWDQAIRNWRRGIVFRLDNPEDI